MEVPKYSFITLIPKEGPIMAGRWVRDLTEAYLEITADHAFRQKHGTAPDNFSVFARFASCKNKAELAIELMTVSITVFDSFQCEINTLYREHFRDTHWPDAMFEDADTVSVKEILGEFYRIHPEVVVINMMPLDFDGTFGFVVIPKDMNP